MHVDPGPLFARTLSPEESAEIRRQVAARFGLDIRTTQLTEDEAVRWRRALAQDDEEGGER